MATPAALASRVPVTLLTGFLGSGKTTLLNHILDNKRNLKFAVIENEFGAVGVDEDLIQNRAYATTDEIIEKMNGCICCTVRSDLITVLRKLLIVQKRKFDGIIIETTGLADPAPVIQTFFVDEDISSVCVMDSVITVVSAAHIIQQLERERPEGVENEAEEQIVFADRILLNKVDLVPEEEKLKEIEKRVRALNPTAEIIRCEQSRVDPERLLGLRSFSLDRVLEFEPEFLQDDGDHKHDQSVKSLSIVAPDALNVHRIQRWVSELISAHGEDLLRYKGIMSIKGFEERYVFHGVHMLWQGTFTTPWKEGEKRINKMVFIGRNLNVEELQLAFHECRAETSLRFPIDAPVLANVGSWKAGKILKHWDEGNCYRIRLNDGTEVWGPIDDDQFVRAPEAPKK